MSKWGDRVRCTTVIAFSCAAVTVLAGCSTGPGSPETPTGAGPTFGMSPAGGTAIASVGATASAGSTAPLTGLAATAATAKRPAVAVAMASSDPVGLGQADLVFAEMVSPVRYLAVFQSNEASMVGPVTSTLPMDGQALSVLHPLTSYNGGTSAFISVLDATKIIDVGYAEHRSVYSAGSGRLTVSTAALTTAGRSDGPPPKLFLYRTPGTSLASVKETHPASVRVEIPGQAAEQWSFDARANRWVETAGGPRVSVANLVVQIVSFRTVYLSHRYGLTAQSARVIGTGVATVFSGAIPGKGGGSAATGTWDKPGLAALTNYFDAAHTPMNFEPGPTWVVLAPAGARTSQGGG